MALVIYNVNKKTDIEQYSQDQFSLWEQEVMSSAQSVMMQMSHARSSTSHYAKALLNLCARTYVESARSLWFLSYSLDEEHHAALLKQLRRGYEQAKSMWVEMWSKSFYSEGVAASTYFSSTPGISESRNKILAKRQQAVDDKMERQRKAGNGRRAGYGSYRSYGRGGYNPSFRGNGGRRDDSEDKADGRRCFRCEGYGHIAAHCKRNPGKRAPKFNSGSGSGRRDAQPDASPSRN